MRIEEEGWSVGVKEGCSNNLKQPLSHFKLRQVTVTTYHWLMQVCQIP